MGSPPTDELDRTARQVRLPGGLTHRLATACSALVGRVYTTDCDQALYGLEGAILTTDDADCPWCNGTGTGRP